MTPNDFVDLLSLISAESIRYFWMPLCIWTLLAGGFLLADRLSSNYHPSIKYNLGTVLLWSLPVGILLAYLLPLSITAPVNMNLVAPLPAESALQQGTPSAPDSPVFRLEFLHFFGLLPLVLFTVGFLKMGRLVLDAKQLLTIRKSLTPGPLDATYPELNKKRMEMGIRRAVQIVFSEEATVPVTFGWRNPIIVLPNALREDATHARITIIHELGHIAQHDYLRRFIEKIIQCGFFFNPLVNVLISRIDQYREMTCDSQVLHFGQTSAGQYARFLLSLSLPESQHSALAIHIADSGSKLKNRIKAMKNERLSIPKLLKNSKLGISLFALLLIASALIVACEVDFAGENRALETENNSSAEQVPGDGEVFMIVEEMPELLGGLASLQSEIQYPAIAKNAGIEGRVFVQFVVDESGNVQDPVVVRGIGGGCDEEAIRGITDRQI